MVVPVVMLLLVVTVVEVAEGVAQLGVLVLVHWPSSLQLTQIARTIPAT
jgi:hypothetical protein